MVPDALFNDINKHIQKVKSNTFEGSRDGMCANYTLCLRSNSPCKNSYSQLGSFQIRIDNHEITLEPSTYLLDEDNKCYVMLTGKPINVTLPADDTTKIIIGTHMLSFLETIFDYDERFIKFYVKPEMRKNIQFGSHSTHF